MYNKIFKSLIISFLSWIPFRFKLKCLHLLISDNLNRLSQTNRIAERSYGIFPQKLRAYEQLYDQITGGWINPSVQTQQRDYGSVELEVGRFWYAFVRLTNPKMILETGTYLGYSTSCLASAISHNREGGHLYTIDPYHTQHLWEQTELTSLITWIPKHSQDAFADVREYQFDLLVLDSDHNYKTVMWELINFEKLLNIGGYILMHDSLFYDGVGAAVKQLSVNSRFEVLTTTSPRTHGNPAIRCPGITIIRKVSVNGVPLQYEAMFNDWYIGDPETPPYLFKE